ncbi:hypothetical protein ACWYRQ_03615 [Clostridioides difficile]
MKLDSKLVNDNVSPRWCPCKGNCVASCKGTCILGCHGCVGTR